MSTKIVTHSGIFHADDVCAFAILEEVLAFRGASAVELIRTRDPKVIEAADICIDVGNVYNAGRKRYDHHQSEADGRPAPRKNGVPYSSFGLVWEHWGFRYLDRLLGDTSTLMSEATKIWQLVDERIVQPVDAADCGVALVVDPTETFAGIRAMSFSAVISGFNPLPGATPEDFHHEFMVAMRFAGEAIGRAVFRIAAEVRMENGVKLAMTNANDPRIVVLREGSSWQRVICANEVPLYVVFPAETGDEWMVRCVPPVAGSFEQRRPLPSFWAGLRDEMLAVVTGVTDAVFCHNGRFICGARSREGALELARLAVEAG